MDTSLFKKYEGVEFKKTRRTERSDLIELFLSKLNPPRKEHNLKPLTFGFISMYFKDRKMDNHQLYAFHRDCERATIFSAYFWSQTRFKRVSNPLAK